MRTVWVTLAILLILQARPAEAGVYCTDKEVPDTRFVPTIGPRVEGADVQKIPFRSFPLMLSEMFQLRNPKALPTQPAGTSAEKKKSLRELFTDRADDLRHALRRGNASLEDQINLGAYLIWLADYPAAIAVLKPLADDPLKHQENFMLFANLGTAYLLSGNVSEAGFCLIQVRKYLSPEHDNAKLGLTPGQLAWYREAEKGQLDLLKLRGPEGGKPPPEPEQKIDDLFGVKFADENGNFQAGKIAAAEKEKLPKNAVALVQQLLLWLPDASGNYDLRLYWLLGEVFNAQGQTEDGYKVFDACVWGRQYRPTELQQHRQVLLEALAPAVEPPWTWLPELPRLLVVGIATVLALLFLGFLQLRQYRRRRLAGHP